jgi:transposase
MTSMYRRQTALASLRAELIVVPSFSSDCSLRALYAELRYWDTHHVTNPSGRDDGALLERPQVTRPQPAQLPPVRAQGDDDHLDVEISGYPADVGDIAGEHGHQARRTREDGAQRRVGDADAQGAPA